MKTFVAFGVCLVLMAIFAGERGLPALLQARRQAEDLTREIARLRDQNLRLRQRVEALRADPRAIERVARESMGLARPDELVVTRRR